jgi:hypothetical protein
MPKLEINKMKKQSLKQFIFRKLGTGKYVLDKDIVKFGKGENIPFYQAEVYKREYRSLEYQKNYFKEYENHPDTMIGKYKNSYKWAKTKFNLYNETLIGKNRSYKITKSYYLYLKDKGIKEYNY